MTEDAEYLVVAFGSAARIAQKAIEDCRSEGIKVGLLRPITLWPFPTKRVAELAGQVKGILCAEINAGQMVQGIRLAVEGKTPVSHYGRMGGMVPTPEEIAEVIRKQLVQE
jgi:2-oxoglutarate ferredoxin oxidoreductase subunit alpha